MCYFNDSMILASWLHDHPNVKVLKRNSFFWYDDKSDHFYYCTPSSVKNNRDYCARGLEGYYSAYCRASAD